MKEKRTTKLYEGLTSKRKATLTLHYMGEQDATEIERIRSTVPWKDYRCMDAEYTDWRDRLLHITMAWGLDYWRAVYVHAHAVHQLTRLDLKAADSEALQAFTKADERVERALARIVALQEALKDVCQQHGLDHEDVIKVAGVPVRKWPKCEPDRAYQEVITAELLECLPPAQ